MKRVLGGYLWPDSSAPFSEEQRREFAQATLEDNLSRTLRIGRILLVSDLLFLAHDWMMYRRGEWGETGAYAYLFGAHVLLALALVLFLAVAWSVLKPEGGGSPARRRHLLGGIVSFVCVWAIAVSAIDQRIHGQVTAYVMCVLGLAVVVCLDNRAGAMVFVPAYGLFVAGVWLFQDDPKMRWGHALNGATITLVAWVISRVLFRERVRDFLNRSLIGRQEAELRRMADEDYLTGLPNRRYLERLLAQEFSRCRRHGHRLTVAIADLDGFKRINDTLSHAAGDRVLSEVAALLRGAVRVSDVVARYGGDEFVIVFPETDLEQAKVVCDRARRALECQVWDGLAPGTAITVSFGLCDDPGAENYERMLNSADVNLHRAKEMGRNQLV